MSDNLSLKVKDPRAVADAAAKLSTVIGNTIDAFEEASKTFESNAEGLPANFVQVRDSYFLPMIEGLTTHKEALDKAIARFDEMLTTTEHLSNVNIASMLK